MRFMGLCIVPATWLHDWMRIALLSLAGSSSLPQVEAFAADIAERVRQLAIHHPRSPVARFVTVSAGAASLVPGQAQGAEDLLEEAIAALEAGLKATPGASRAGA